MKKFLLLFGLIAISFVIAFDAEMQKANLSRLQSQQGIREMQHDGLVAHEVSDEMLRLQKARRDENTLRDPGQRYRRPGQEIYGEVFTHAAPSEQLALYADKPTQLQYYLSKGGRTGGGISKAERERRRLSNTLHVEEGVALEESIIAAGANDVEVLSFALRSAAIDIVANQIDLLVEGGFSNGVRDDFQTIDSLSLWYADGTPIKYLSGRDAKSGSFFRDEVATNSGLISFSNLDLDIGFGATDIIVKADIRTAGDDADDTALDAALFSISLYEPENINNDVSGVSLNYIQDTAHRVLATEPIITLHPHSSESVVSDTDVSMTRLTIENPANDAESDIVLKALAFELRTEDGENDDLAINNLSWRDINNPSVSLATCRRFDLPSLTAMTGEQVKNFVCNFEVSETASISNDNSGFIVAQGDSEDLVLFADISNYDFEKDAVQVRILTDATARSEHNADNLYDPAYDFANPDSDKQSAIIWKSRESNELSSQLSQNNITHCMELIDNYFCPLKDAERLEIGDLPLSPTTVAAGESDVSLFQTTITHNGSLPYVIDSLVFDINIDSEYSDNLENISLYNSFDGGTTWTLLEDRVTIHPIHNVIDFSDFSQLFHLGVNEDVEILVTTHISEVVSAPFYDFNLALDPANVSVLVNGSDEEVVMADSVAYGPTITVRDAGTLSINNGSLATDSTTYVAGSDLLSFSSFDLSASDESFSVEDIMISIWGGFEDKDGNTGFKTIDSVSLWYADGSPVRFDNNSNALLTGINLVPGETNSGTVSFTDLNLLVPHGQTETIVVKASLATTGDDSADTAASDVPVRVGLASPGDIHATGLNSTVILHEDSNFGGNYDFFTSSNPMQIVGNVPVFTLHASSTDTVASGENLRLFDFTIVNPSNASSSDLWMKALAFSTDIVDGSGNDLSISNFKLYDISNPSSSIADCHRSDDDTLNVITDIDNMTMICNFEAELTNTVSATRSGHEISNGSSEHLFLTVDVSGFNIVEDSLLFSLDGFGSLNTAVNYNDISDTSFDFGQDTPNKTSVIWYDEEGEVLISDFDTDAADFRSNRLTAF